MSVPKIFARLFSWPMAKSLAAVNYDDIFKSEAITPPAGTLDSQWRIGLCPLTHDAYFKEVFAGPVL